MKRLLVSTTALAVALSGMMPAPIFAQDTTVECTDTQPCPEDKAAKKAAKKAEKKAAEAAAAGDAPAAGDDANAGEKAEEKAAKKAEKAKEKDAAKAEEAAAADETEAPTETAPAETAPAVVEAPADTAPVAETAPEPEPAPAPEAAPAATATDEPATAPAETTTATGTETGAATTEDADKAAKKADRKARKEAEKAEAAPEPAPEATEALEGILTTTDAEAPPAAAAAETTGTAPAATAVGTTETTLTEDNTRSSSEEFTGTARADGKDRKKDHKKGHKKEDEPEPTAVRRDNGGLSDFEKFGLVALGALAVGAILKNGDRVVENTGDRVVVSRSDGTYQVLKDDDTLIRQPGSTVRTETFADGSTRTTVTRTDGSQVVTIRDAAGRVLRRSSYDAQGREIVLIDDLTAPVRPIDVTTLPRLPEVTLSAAQDPAALEAALAAARARDVAAGGFSLAQVRDLREVRALAPRIEVAPITFASGSAAIDPSEAEKLAELGGLVARLVKERPNEMFLIEGHTDAVGSAASNLALSDRRAESVALALTEYFDVPPENLVVQGYGEGDLLVPTEAAEPANRRVAVRVITPLLAAAR